MYTLPSYASFIDCLTNEIALIYSVRHGDEVLLMIEMIHSR